MPDKYEITKPSLRQIEWADCEIGVIIHLDIQVFYPEACAGNLPPPQLFNPAKLDTDQWLESARNAGAKYAVLTAKHGSGFALWPTEANDYSVKNTSWRNGKGDIVADFISSCEKYSIRPGLYYNTGFNSFCNVVSHKVLSGGKNAQISYSRTAEKQVTELWSNYGNLFEIWFDGGLAKEKEGPDIVPILLKYQPDSICFQGPSGKAPVIRWVGNEFGVAPYPCWSTVSEGTSSDGIVEMDNMNGAPDGVLWAPGESDMPLRDKKKAFAGGWIWREGEDDYVYSLKHLVNQYYTSVGRNTNLLLGVVVDKHGLVPEADALRLAEFGNELMCRFSTPLASKAGQTDCISIEFGIFKEINHAVIMEDLNYGERVREYTISGKTNEGWTKICEGTCIGHKRIENFNNINVSEVKIEFDKYSEPPVIRDFSIYKISNINLDKEMTK